MRPFPFSISSTFYWKENIYLISFDALVDGIEQRIILAHDNLHSGSVYVNKGEILDAGVNCSPSAYLNNPSTEHAKYNAGRIVNLNPRRVSNIVQGPQGTQHELLELAASFKSTSGKLVTKYLSIARRVRNFLRSADRPRFVSAFCQTNFGDVSLNILGVFCTDTGLPCDFNQSTCCGKNELCYGRGPGYPDEFESTRIIGERQFKKAADLFNTAYEKLSGKIDFRHTYLDFTQLEVTLPKQGGGSEMLKHVLLPWDLDLQLGNPFWKLVRNVLKTPSINSTGSNPKDIGQMVILSVPGEFTTMAGRRLRDAVSAVFKEKVHVVIAGLTNTYSQYITTYEEYEMQRYEGASTLYCPHTLSAYIQEFTKLATAIVTGITVEAGPQPPDLLDKEISLLPGVVMDSTPLGVKFGDVKTDVAKDSTFKKGDTVTVVFWSACPINDLMTEGTYALVELLQGQDTWVPAFDDDDICLCFKWSRPSKLSAQSHATIEWRIPQSTASGFYRVTHFGALKNLLGSISHFTGSSSAFVVK
ncbi:neutral/alkaline non-lysosomal ceramidase [Artemisia annua]|uniref:Neutral ceramidase n=1 Tax=Artemisia annua TaxID=35608 RepID=A0A2U1L9P7_ARTAN|nr:neutral/alkaline non-lysosomal ceramidase [Artemisia annua]